MLSRGAADAGSEAHRKVYWFNVKAFQAADADRFGGLYIVYRLLIQGRSGGRHRVWQDDGRGYSCTEEVRDFLFIAQHLGLPAGKFSVYYKSWVAFSLWNYNYLMFFW